MNEENKKPDFRLRKTKDYASWPPYAPGTHIRESDIRDKKIAYTWWEPEVQYAWSCGHAMNVFLEGL
ncbi:MAG: hypothetical protein ACTSVV_15265, partial [Promethearchaeota archaeon]